MCVVDIDKWPVRPLIKAYIEKGFSYLFEHQVVSYSSAHRRACYDMIAEAIRKAVAECADEPTTHKSSGKAAAKAAPAHAHTVPAAAAMAGMGADAIEVLVRQQITRVHGSAHKFFESAKSGRTGEIGKREFKRAIHRLGVRHLTDAARKRLRKRIARGSGGTSV